MDAIFGWDSSGEEEDEVKREIAKKEEMEQRQRDIDEYRMKIRKSEEIDEGPERKLKKFTQVSLLDALEWQLVTIGDDDLREKYRNMMFIVEKHFLGEELQYQEEVEQIESFQDLKEFIFQRHLQLRIMNQKMEENDEYIGLHEFLVQFTVKILKALTTVTKIGKIEQCEYNKNEGIFEEYWTKAHNVLLRNNRVRFRNLFDLYQESEKQQVDDIIKETEKQLSELLNLTENDDIVDLISEMANVTMEENNHIRETSPPPISRSFSQHSIEQLMEATDYMRTESSLHQFQPNSEQPNNGTVHDELYISSESDDEENGNCFMSKELTRNLTPQVDVETHEPVETVESMEVDESNHNNTLQHIEMKPILFPIRKKKVRFVDFDSPSNTMRIFCHPLDWYRDDGDDGVTLAYVDSSLREGWKFLRHNLPIPYQLKRHPGLRPHYCKQQERVNKISQSLEYFELPHQYNGVFGSRIWYPSNISNESAIYLGLQETYTPDELSQCIESGMFPILHAFRKCYSREFVAREDRSNSTIHRIVVAKTNTERGRNYDNYKNDVMCEWRRKKYYAGRISTCFVLSDWRLFSVDTSVFVNAELKTFPSHLGNVFFSAVMKFLRELFSYDWIEIKTLVFAFGGHESFELNTICRFLVFVQKLLVGRNVQIHWITNNWINRNEIQEKGDRVSRKQYEYLNLCKLNAKVGQFVGQMSKDGMTNMHFYDISNRLLPQVRKNPADELEFTLSSYMQYFHEECNVVLKSTFFPQQQRAFTSDYVEDELKFVYNKEKRWVV